MQPTKLAITAQTSMDDIVFANRNKAYGAYDLRKLYDKHIARSLLFGGLFAVLAISSPLIAKFLETMGEKDEKFVMKEVTLEPPPPLTDEPPPPPPPEIPPPPKVDMIKFLPPDIKPDEQVKEEAPPPEQKELEKSTPSNETVKGDPNAQEVIADVVVDEKKVEVDDKPKDEIFTAVEIMPMPNGGFAAFNKYLVKTLQYPKAAQRANIGGKVFVTFVVTETGQITNVAVLKGLGFGCDEEAVRVVSQAPPWIPGKQGGRPVKVKYTLPINFALQSN